MKKRDIDPEKPSIGGLFNSSEGLRYVIPRYQRAYAWEKSNAEKLWKDINTINHKQNKDDYFMGTMVIRQAEESKEIEVIDGQQRLTTVCLLLFALYLHYQKFNAAKATQHILKYLRIGDIDDEYLILTLSRVNAKCFNELLNLETKQDYIEYKGNNYKKDIKSNKSLFDVLDYFLYELESSELVDNNLEQNRLNEILKIIRENIFFLTLKVTDYKEASQLFETLNNRGVDLTKADLIKNYLFARADEQASLTKVEKNWNILEDNIGIDKLEQFFRYFSLMYSKEDDVYVRMEQIIQTKSALTVSEMFVKDSDRYKIFIEPTYSNDDKESFLFDELKILGVTQFYSFILASYNQFKFNDILKLLEATVNFTFRYNTICGKNPNKLDILYSNLAYDIIHYNLTISSIINEIEKLNPSDQEFEISFKEKEFKSSKIPRYILGKIESYIGTKEKIVDFDSVHLEHIMPQKIDKWIKYDSKYEKLHQKFLNKIGNMTLLSQKINISIKNSIFTEKLKEYQKSEINLLKDIKLLTKWEESEINNNTQKYLNYAERIWKI